MPDPSPFEIETAICKFENYKSPGNDQFPAELIEAEGEILWFEIHTIINSVWNEEELSDEWKESIIVSVYKKGDKTSCSNYRALSLVQLLTKLHPTTLTQS
jgi:hypothetical protein